MAETFKRLWRWISELDTTIAVVNWIKAGSGVVACMITALTAWMNDQPASILFVLTLATLLIVVYLINGILWLRNFWNVTPKQTADDVHEKIGSIEPAGSDIKVFSDRGELNQARSLNEQLAKASNIHAFWTTGAKAFDEGKEWGRIKRLILPNPDCDSLERYRTSYDSATDLGNSIRNVTKTALKKGIPVKWYDDYIGYSLMIGDPDMDHGWIHIEMGFPCMPKGDHPSFTLTKAAYPKLIKNMAQMFDELWLKSKSPVIE